MTKHHKTPPSASLPAGVGGLPLVCIVGRPNVGKSTLFNRLARRKIAIVHDEPGVTRDRHYVDAQGFGRRYTLVDTGGFDPEDADPMRTGIAEHVKVAVAEADVVVFVTDATSDLTQGDRAAVKLLRSSGKPVVYAANKADAPARDAEAFDLYRLGVEKVHPVSALHGRGIGDLEAAVIDLLPPADPAEEERQRRRLLRHGSSADEEDEEVTTSEADVAAAGPTRIAIVGRPNGGKSSLLNRILGEERMLVDDKPGTTRDAIDALVERGGRPYVLVDTAGIRRKAKVSKAEDAVEALSVLHAIRAIERSEVVILLCDAGEGVSEQDAKILGLAHDRSRAMVIALNKTDLLSRQEADLAEERAREKLSFAAFVPVVRVSAKTGRGVGQLFETVDRTREAFVKRVGTGPLNRFFETVLDTHPPPTSGGKAPRLFYITQAETAPPTFVAISNAPDAIHFSYRRFVVNQLRKHFGFDGVPVRVFYKAKRKVHIGKR